MTHRGMSLIEAVVWVGLFTAVMLAVTQAVLFFYRNNGYVLEQAEAITAAQRGIDATVRTIREAAYSSVGAYPIISMATSSFSFYANVDNDSHIERVRFFLEDEVLYRAVVQPAGDPATYEGAEFVSTVAEHVKNEEEARNVFTYYDEDGEEMGDLNVVGSLRFVTVDVVADIHSNKGPERIMLHSSAALRNLTQ